LVERNPIHVLQQAIADSLTPEPATFTLKRNAPATDFKKIAPAVARKRPQALDLATEARTNLRAKTLSNALAAAASLLTMTPQAVPSERPALRSTFNVEVAEFRGMDVFNARMTLFRESGKMPAWVEDSAQATLDLNEKAPHTLQDGGFVSIDHAHAQCL